MSDDPLRVRVAERIPLSDRIVELRLVDADGGLLPGFSAGAHVTLEIPGEPGQASLWRSYSLVHLDPGDDPSAPRKTWRLGIRLEEASTGGSRFIHEKAVPGTVLNARPPANHFPLSGTDDEVTLIAGGIGITPIVSMMTALAASRRRFTLHYTSRSGAQLAFLDEIRAVGGNHVHLYADDEPARAFSLDALFAGCRPNRPIYVCGPKGLIDAVFRAAQARGWDGSKLHSELFAVETPAGDAPFEVELRSGKVIEVAGDKTLLQALLDAGIYASYDCRAGYCGLCTVGVRSGEIDHRDNYLSDEEKAGGTLIQACVSRGKTKLQLDI